MKGRSLAILFVTSVFFVVSVHPVFAQGNDPNRKKCKTAKKLLNEGDPANPDDDKGKIIKMQTKIDRRLAFADVRHDKYEDNRQKALDKVGAARAGFEATCFKEGATIVQAEARTTVDDADTSCLVVARKDRGKAKSEGKILAKPNPSSRIVASVDRMKTIKERLITQRDGLKTDLVAANYSCGGVTS